MYELQPVSRGKYWTIRSRLEGAVSKQIKEHSFLMRKQFSKEDIEAFAKTLSEEGVKEGLRGQVSIAPPFKHAGPLAKSKDVLLGEENFIKAMRFYALQVNRKLALDPVIMRFRKTGDQDLEGAPNLKEMILNQFAVEKGRYSFGDRAVDHTIKQLDTFLLKRSKGRYDTSSLKWPKIRLGMYSELVGEIRRNVARLKLGYRPVAALVNAASGMNHLITKVGYTYVWKGYKFLQTPEGKAYMGVADLPGDKSAYMGNIQKPGEAAYMGASFAIEEGSVKRPYRIRPWGSMYIFQLPELPLRKVTLAANYLYGKEQLELGPEAAKLYARRALRFQQFVYNAAALPYLLQGPTGKLFGQFKTYMVNEIQYWTSLRNAPGQILHYAGMQWAFGGTKSLLYILYGLPILGWALQSSELDQYMNREAPRIHRGLPSLAPYWINQATSAAGVGDERGVDLPELDLSMQFTPTVPHSKKDWASFIMGPALTDFYGFGQWATETYIDKIPDAKHRGFDLLTNAFIAVKYFTEGLAMRVDRDGALMDDRGDKVWQPNNPVDVLFHMIGARSSEESIQRDLSSSLAKKKALAIKRRTAQGHKYLREYQQWLNANNIRSKKDFRNLLDKWGNDTNNFLVQVSGVTGYPQDYKQVLESLDKYVDMGGTIETLEEHISTARMEPILREIIRDSWRYKPEHIENWRSLYRFRHYVTRPGTPEE
jgi:hypothetical protein